MSWTIILEDENKNQISKLKDEFDVKVKISEKEFKLFQYIDSFGNTTFNRLQMDDLISDLSKLKLVEDNSKIVELIELAEKCKNGIHYYLVFYGD